MGNAGSGSGVGSRDDAEADPTFAEAHFSLGLLDLEQGKFDVAEDAFCTAIRANPEAIRLLTRLLKQIAAASNEPTKTALMDMAARCARLARGGDKESGGEDGQQGKGMCNR